MSFIGEYLKFISKEYRMRRTSNLGQIVLYQLGEQDEFCISQSESDSDFDDEVEDPSFTIDVEGDDEQAEQPASTSTAPAKGRGRGRQRGKENRCRSRSPCDRSSKPHHSPEARRTGSVIFDTAPEVSRVMPHRPPGVQVDTHSAHSPRDLFQLFFSTCTMKTLCKNTNKYAAIQQKMGKKYNWADVEVEELYKFFGLLMYTTLVPLPRLQDYWKQNHILSVPFPAVVMTRDRFRALMWNIHPSNPKKDVINDRKKGTPDYDRLFRIQPLMDEIRAACQANYHPRKELAVDERMVATKGKTGMTQYVKGKPTQKGIKLFVLAESSSGYTVNFNVYGGKIPCPTPATAYNERIGGVDLYDQLIQYHSTHRQTARWYRMLFLHFVDIAATNAYIMHCEISSSQQVQPMTHKVFLTQLVSELCEVDKMAIPNDRSSQHVPVALATATDASQKATQGRRACQRCHQVDKKRNLTPWRCKACDVPLCVIVDRNCFEEWHM